jgi:branched-chain amino acid aminotransferase
MSIEELLEDVKSGACTEAFACGTAVIITPINTLGTPDGQLYPLKHEQGPISQRLRESLLNIQEGTGDDPFGWRVTLEPRP